MDLPSAIGLGLDIAGATIISVALLGSPATLVLRAATLLGSNPYTSSAEIESRTDAEYGIPTLVIGFMGQLIGLSVDSEASLCVGYGAATLCAVGAFSTWRWIWRPWRSKRLAEEIARYTLNNTREGPQRQPLPDVNLLASLGVGLGSPMREGESADAYAARVFKVTETRDEEE